MIPSGLLPLLIRYKCRKSVVDTQNRWVCHFNAGHEESPQMSKMLICGLFLLVRIAGLEPTASTTPR